jgi:hypothetical protein
VLISLLLVTEVYLTPMLPSSDMIARITVSLEVGNGADCVRATGRLEKINHEKIQLVLFFDPDDCVEKLRLVTLHLPSRRAPIYELEYNIAHNIVVITGRLSIKEPKAEGTTLQVLL